MTGLIERRLKELGLGLPDSCAPRGDFLPYRVHGDTVYLAGQICEWNGTVICAGQVGDAVDVETAARAAESCALNLLFHLRAACDGDLDRVRACLRVGGFVNGVPGFAESPRVVDGASSVFIRLFGDAGRHARTAVAVAGLPANAAVEVDAIFAIESPA
jgi:enamine deaminase RidA (YjgF/YER057c/UK114 family)